MGRFAINPSCLHLGDFHKTIGPLKVSKIHKPNLSPFEGIPGGWDGGGGFGENIPVLSLVLIFLWKRELEGRQEDFEIQHHLTMRFTY